MTVTVLVGNPKPKSRTYDAALAVTQRLTDAPPDTVIDLTDLAPALLDWSDPKVAELVATVTATDLLIVASPTYKATYTGLLKLFLDRIGTGALVGVVAVPVMLGGDWRHSMAPDLLLKPVLVELGATCPTGGLFLLDSEPTASEQLDRWVELSRPAVLATRRAAE